MKVRHLNRQTRNCAKRAAKMRYIRGQKLRSEDGPVCPHCEPHRNAVFKKLTHTGRQHLMEELQIA